MPAEAAKELGLMYSTIISWGKSDGYQWPTNKQRTYTAGQRAQALQMARSGYTRRQVAEELDIKLSTLKFWGQKWRAQGIFDWPIQRGYRPGHLNRKAKERHWNCQTCEYRPKCGQHHCHCEEPLIVEGHPEELTMTYEEAQAYYG
jgi:transposase